MFKKILIANRGEIACRIIRSCRAMGIKTVAVYSEADSDALHVRNADEAIAIGPSPAAQSYLVIDRLVEAARTSGADAVHPGFGFLSENRAFAAALKKAGIVFIGPSPKAIAAMGDKIESKKLAIKAKVSTVPGHLGVIRDDKEALRIAREIGFPVMIKASAGGGGKGMRIARDDSEVQEGFRAATSEAKSSFADDRVFIEKFIENPRHIEIQVLADSHGNCLHLGERECSIQRRHQKVLEEAPSPFLDEKTRAAMGKQAVALAKAVDYESAGTVEFIVDEKKNFYFLEMNTRLQVEHPVTEMVTGIDIVEQMIRVANGEQLAFRQKDIKLKGWAVEARVYAEDPSRGFLPSIGRLVRYREPAVGGSIRVDSGVYEGAEISMYYDPMIAKVIGFGANRRDAIGVLSDGLDSYLIRGVSHNLAFLSAVLRHPRFIAGRLSTGFITEEFPQGFSAAPAGPASMRLLAAVAAVVHHQHAMRDQKISGRLHEFAPGSGGEWVVVHGGGTHRITVAETAGGYAAIEGDDSHEFVSGWRVGEPIYQGTVNGRPTSIQVERRGIGYRLSHGGIEADLKVLSPRAAMFATLMPTKRVSDMSKYLLSPMPGLLVSILVAPGQEVKAGQELCVVEAMKMENMLRAERDGRIATFHAKSGDSLAVDQPILEFE